jgi:hypothetical protein
MDGPEIELGARFEHMVASRKPKNLRQAQPSALRVLPGVAPTVSLFRIGITPCYFRRTPKAVL